MDNTPTLDDRLVDLADAFMNRRRGMLPVSRKPIVSDEDDTIPLDIPTLTDTEATPAPEPIWTAPEPLADPLDNATQEPFISFAERDLARHMQPPMARSEPVIPPSETPSLSPVADFSAAASDEPYLAAPVAPPVAAAPATPPVTPAMPAPMTEPDGEQTVSGLDPAVLKILVSEVSRNIGRHLTGQLPELLYNTTLATLEADLRRGILAATEEAAQNFIAQRQRLAEQQRHQS